MKIKLHRSLRYINYGAIPTKEYESGTVNLTAEPNLSEKEESSSKHGLIANQARFKFPVKVRPQQKFRQDRAGRQKPSVTSLGWRTNRTSQRSAGSDTHR